MIESNFTVACRMVLYNALPYGLFLDQTCLSHGIWIDSPPAFISPFDIVSFKAIAPLTPVHTFYKGVEVQVTYKANNTASDDFKLYCDVPYNGAVDMSVSNPDASAFRTFFECEEALPSIIELPNTSFVFPKSNIGVCKTQSKNLVATYHLASAINTKFPMNPTIQDRGSSYIKLSNLTPYTLHLISTEEVFGWWERAPDRIVHPNSATSWAHLFQDVAVGEQSKCSMLYTYPTHDNNKVGHIELEVFNPFDTASDDACRSTHPDSHCRGVNSNSVKYEIDMQHFNIYYECSADNTNWSRNYCDKFSDLLYVHFYFTEI